MGTTVLRIIAYEKKTRSEITTAPSTGSFGMRSSRGRNTLKCCPIIVSQTAQATVQNMHMDSKKKTIWRRHQTNGEVFN
jgi:hypothetical protein